MEKILNQHSNFVTARIAKGFNHNDPETVRDFIEKSATGEGSRGGKIIGHTKSGKPIYEGHTHSMDLEIYGGHQTLGKKHDAFMKKHNIENKSHELSQRDGDYYGRYHGTKESLLKLKKGIQEKDNDGEELRHYITDLKTGKEESGEEESVKKSVSNNIEKSFNSIMELEEQVVDDPIEKAFNNILEKNVNS